MKFKLQIEWNKSLMEKKISVLKIWQDIHKDKCQLNRWASPDECMALDTTYHSDTTCIC